MLLWSRTSRLIYEVGRILKKKKKLMQKSIDNIEVPKGAGTLHNLCRELASTSFQREEDVCIKMHTHNVFVLIEAKHLEPFN